MNAARQIRVLCGPLQGLSRVVGPRLQIGRASSSDIQLLDDDVSRQHASIIEDPQGVHLLVDLHSSNGTRVGARRIARQRLQPGTIFEILRTQFVYEHVPRRRTTRTCHRPPRRSGMPTLRRTRDHGDLDLPTPVLAQRLSRSVTPLRPSAHGRRYPGNLVDDIREFRRMLVRAMGGTPTAPRPGERFEALQWKLQRSSALGARGEYPRFSFHRLARIRLKTGQSLPVMLTNLGADGARILSIHQWLCTGTPLWLSLGQGAHPNGLTTVFQCRVQRAERDYADLNFLGEPFQSSVGRTPAPTAHRDDAPRAPSSATLGPLELRRVKVTT